MVYPRLASGEARDRIVVGTPAPMTINSPKIYDSGPRSEKSSVRSYLTRPKGPGEGHNY